MTQFFEGMALAKDTLGNSRLATIGQELQCGGTKASGGVLRGVGGGGALSVSCGESSNSQTGGLPCWFPLEPSVKG